MSDTGFNPSKDDLLYHYKDYIQHTQWVSEGLGYAINQLMLRLLTHDRTKIEEPELNTYAAVVPGFAQFEYGTKEHEEHGKKLGPAWGHHVHHNKHHVEHFENGVLGMSLIDLIEMVCDWRAASLRSGEFDYEKSVAVFKRNNPGVSSDLLVVLLNTCKLLDEKCGKFPKSQRSL